MPDKICHLTLSHVVLPPDNPVSDAKVLTGRQKPLTETVLLFAEISTEDGFEGMGFSYSKRAGGRAQLEVADVAIGQDPSDIDRIYQSLLWAGASVGRSGVATQAIATLDVALWDLKARRANLPLAKLIGAHRDSCQVYNTSGGFLQASVEEIEEKASAALESGIGGIKMKVGQPDWKTDLERVAAIREHLGDNPFMVDANQQWDRARAKRMCRKLEAFDLVWIEEPLDAWDAVGHPPFLRFATLASHANLPLAPHYAMEIHLHLAATYPTEPSDRMRALTKESATIGTR
jgi:L-alanine-DL-glutamate epimerase-like enolase superfamily enzyme